MEKRVSLENLQVSQADGTLTCDVEVRDRVVFDVGATARLLAANGGEALASYALQAGHAYVMWLPRGRYRFQLRVPAWPRGAFPMLVTFDLQARVGNADTPLGELSLELQQAPATPAHGAEQGAAWSITSLGDTPPVSALGWNNREDNWFFLHFDHCARVIIDLLLDRHPFLRGKVLDVGCGDGITDLGVFLRCQPEEFVGIDPDRGYRNLRRAARENHLPDDCVDDPRLRFEPHDGNAIPYPDSHFDVVISWGAMEHIVGGYRKALEEIRRVLKPDGLFFCHPGLYYSTAGNHLGEFFDDPWIHLKLGQEELRERVLGSEPDYMDRCGAFATPEQYWQWYRELNRITPASFENELRAVGFEPWRVALRNCDLVEYTPELQPYSFVDLATADLYVSAWNRK